MVRPKNVLSPPPPSFGKRNMNLGPEMSVGHEISSYLPSRNTKVTALGMHLRMNLPAAVL